MSRSSQASALVRAASRDLAALLVPVECAGCGTADVPWCSPCARLLDGPPWRCEERAGRFDRLVGEPVPVWALAECAGALRQAVVAWKDGGRADLGGVFATALRDAATHVAGALVAEPGTPGRLVVVAVPSSGASRRRRGGNLVDALAAAVADGLRRGGLDARPLDALRRRAGADQVGLGARARARNLVGRVRIRARVVDELDGARVVLVDDVLTTGASLSACREVLETAGAGVVAALALASTPRPATTTREPPGAVGPGPLRTAAGWG